MIAKAMATAKNFALSENRKDLGKESADESWCLIGVNCRSCRSNMAPILGEIRPSNTDGRISGHGTTHFLKRRAQKIRKITQQGQEEKGGEEEEEEEDEEEGRNGKKLAMAIAKKCLETVWKSFLEGRCT